MNEIYLWMIIHGGCAVANMIFWWLFFKQKGDKYAVLKSLFTHVLLAPLTTCFLIVFGALLFDEYSGSEQDKFDDSTDTEMVFGLFNKNVKCINFEDPEYNHEKIRMTLDYEEDYQFLNSLAKKFDYKILRSDIENELIYQYSETPNYFKNSEWKSAQLIKSEKTVNELYRKK